MSPKMFPHSIIVCPRSYASDDVGGAIPTDGTGVTMRANVQSAGMDKMGEVFGESSAAQGQQYYDVSTATDPNVIAEQTITWNGVTLITQDRAAQVFRGRLYRVRCVTRS